MAPLDVCSAQKALELPMTLSPACARHDGSGPRHGFSARMALGRKQWKRNGSSPHAGHAVQEQARLHSALCALRVLARKYEFRDETERAPMGAVVEATFPSLLAIFQVGAWTLSVECVPEGIMALPYHEMHLSGLGGASALLCL